MTFSRHRIINIIGRISGTLVVVLAAVFPTVYFAIGWEAQEAALQTEVTFYGRAVTAVINGNPAMWHYEETRLKGLIAAKVDEQGFESRRILDEKGDVVTQWQGDLRWPRMTRSVPLLDSGVTVGKLEISRSLRPMIARTLVLAALGGIFGLALFYLVRMYPMAALRNALDQLSREKERANVTLHSIGDGVIAVDSEAHVVLVNRVAEVMTGWSQAEAGGRAIGDVFRREGSELVARDGSRRLVEVVTSPILDDGGRAVGAVLVFRDVTEKLRTEAELLKAQKLESLGILAGGIAHEIRNPLSGININISSIEHVCENSQGLGPDEKEKIRIIAEQMKSAAQKMASVVQRVMDFSRPTPPHMEVVNLNGAIEEAIRLSASTLRKRGIAVAKELAPDLPACRADPRLIEQVMVNLITNAYQAMEKSDGSKHLQITSVARDAQVVIRVSDSGPGVPPSLRERIFDPFFTTRKDGSGIGLSFSHRIVTDHGGSMRVSTSKWGGAEFWIEIPAKGEGTAA